MSSNQICDQRQKRSTAKTKRWLGVQLQEKQDPVTGQRLEFACRRLFFVR